MITEITGKGGIESSSVPTNDCKLGATREVRGELTACIKRCHTNCIISEPIDELAKALENESGSEFCVLGHVFLL